MGESLKWRSCVLVVSALDNPFDISIAYGHVHVFVFHTRRPAQSVQSSRLERLCPFSREVNAPHTTHPLNRYQLPPIHLLGRGYQPLHHSCEFHAKAGMAATATPDLSSGPFDRNAFTTCVVNDLTFSCLSCPHHCCTTCTVLLLLPSSTFLTATALRRQRNHGNSVALRLYMLKKKKMYDPGDNTGDLDGNTGARTD